MGGVGGGCNERRVRTEYYVVLRWCVAAALHATHRTHTCVLCSESYTVRCSSYLRLLPTLELSLSSLMSDMASVLSAVFPRGGGVWLMAGLSAKCTTLWLWVWVWL